MSPEESRTLWCFLEGNSMPYDVFDIPIGTNVIELKAMIKGRIKCLHDTDARHLRLLKLNMMVPIDPDRSLAQRLADLGNIAAYSRELSSGEEMGELFPEPPSDKHLHIVVQRPGIVPSSLSASRKRSRSATEEDGQAAKRQQIGGIAQDVQTHCIAIHKAIQAMPDNLNLSDPSTFTTLPFPSPLSMPHQRFECKEINGIDHFEYMGRSQFHKLQERIKNRNFLEGAEPIYLYGTSGSGKSHLLAALVYRLVRDGKRVFYIPDCYSLLLNPEQTIRAAWHFAFHDSPVLGTIEYPHDVDALIRSTKNDRDIYIIVDQVNALEVTENKSLEKEKQQAIDWLDNLRFNHRYIFSASANENSYREAYKKQNGISVFEMFGGMSKEETDQWFKWHGHRIPPLSDKQRQLVEYLTGRIPLLLRCLFNMPKFVELEFRKQFYLRNVKSDVDEFARTKLSLLKPLSKKWYLEIMTACVQGDHVTTDNRSLYDLRHFYVDTEQIGRFTCGIAFETMVSILRMDDNASFLGGFWYTTVSQSDNPAVQGFLAEQICLSHISINGLKAVHPELGRMSIASFNTQPNFTHHLSTDHKTCLYIPDDYDFMAVDGIILLLDHTSKQATVFSIQFTLSLNDKQSAKDFHEKSWSTWTEPITSAGFTVHSTFVWIDKEQPSEHVKPEVVKELRSGHKVVHPEYSVIHVGVKEVYPRLASALDIEQ
ncbi:hypothetical protein F5887DRAFT_1274679 [Amanita rubescens]|nr:hypothetical protein F5887DRAFT_1274679 [Amanita rubescens]